MRSAERDKKKERKKEEKVYTNYRIAYMRTCLNYMHTKYTSFDGVNKGFPIRGFQVSINHFLSSRSFPIESVSYITSL